MLIRLIAAIAIVFIAIWLIQMILVRTRMQSARAAPRHILLWDVAPIVAFFGAILLTLSFVESSRREVMDAWRWGIALGLTLGGGAWMIAIYRWNLPEIAHPSAARRAWRLLRTYGTFALVAILAIYLSVRVVGVGLEVLFAGAGGVFLIAVALALFVREWRKRADSNS